MGVRPLAGADGAGTYRDIISAEFNIVTPENEMKFQEIHPQAGTDGYDWAAADYIVSFARSHHMHVRSHNLIWPDDPYYPGDEHFPAWFRRENRRQNILIEIKDHVVQVVSHFRRQFPGTVICWDVLNEALDESGKLKSLWNHSNVEGKDYFAQTFSWAHDADPHAVLFYNDYNLDQRTKFESVLTYLLDTLPKNGTRYGIGFECHFDLHADVKQLRKNMAEAVDHGFEVQITELDVRLPCSKAHSPEALRRQAQVYRGVAAACRSLEPHCSAIIMWGFSDIHSWIRYNKESALRCSTGATIFDCDYKPKPAYYGLELGLQGLNDSIPAPPSVPSPRTICAPADCPSSCS